MTIATFLDLCARADAAGRALGALHRDRGYSSALAFEDHRQAHNDLAERLIAAGLLPRVAGDVCDRFERGWHAAYYSETRAEIARK